jgi:hypothetical protein
MDCMDSDLEEESMQAPRHTSTSREISDLTVDMNNFKTTPSVRLPVRTSEVQEAETAARDRTFDYPKSLQRDPTSVAHAVYEEALLLKHSIAKDTQQHIHNPEIILCLHQCLTSCCEGSTL